MRLTLLANSMNQLIGFVIVAAMGSGGQSVTPALDLTKVPPREEQITSVPGMSVGGIGGQPQSSRYQLPLRIELVSIDPLPTKVGDKFAVEVRLQNTGARPFSFPASQNGVEIFRNEGKNRRSVDFEIVFHDQKTGREVSSVAAVSVGSSTVKGSLLQILPGQQVRILFIGDLRALTIWPVRDIGPIQIRVGALERTFEDSRYFVHSESETVLSDNSKVIELRKP